MSREPHVECDVAVVGAGLAGLMAAETLSEAGYNVYVLEARERVGGRLKSQRLPNGTTVDVGGQWVGKQHQRVLTLADRFGLALFPTHVDGETVFIVDGQRTRRTSLFPDLGETANREIDDALAALDALQRTIDREAPWTSDPDRQFDSQTYQSWIDANVQHPKARAALAYFAMSVLSVEACDVSLLHLLFYIACAGSMDQLINTRDGAQDLRFAGGADALARGLADALSDKVLTGFTVTDIAQTGQHVTVRGSGLCVRARRAIVALPPPLASRIRYSPPLPGLRDQYMQRVAMGTVIKTMLCYEQPFWRAAGLSGLASSAELPVSLVYDNSPHDGSSGILVGFIEAHEGRRWGTKTQTERQQMVLDCMTRYFGPDAATYTDYLELDWAQEEYSRGAYAGYMPPGGWTSYGEAVRMPVDRIHWAGTETATEWNGYMEGALQSGERVAQEVDNALDQRGRNATTKSPGLAT